MANSKNITFDQLQAALSRVKSALDGKANTSHGNHVPKIETANNAKFLRNDNTWQTITPVNIGAADRSHSHGSYVNQNAFTNIKVGDTTVAADSPTDTLTLTAGANVTLTPDATNDSVTIAAKDTVYTHPTTSGYKHIPSGGSSGQILRWSADGTAAWGSDNNTDTKVTNTLNTTAKAYVTGTTSATTNTGTQVFDTGVYLDTTAGKLVATTFAGALSGNASSATQLQTARKFTIGNTERTFNGSGDVKWTLADIGAAAASHNHTSLTGITKLQFAAEGSDAASISTTVDEANTYFDFNLSDDPSQNDTWRWRFSPSGGTVFNAMTLDASSATAADLVVSGSVTASSFTGNASSATKLQTGRAIKIGNTSKNFDGTANVTWTLAEIGAAASSHNHSYVPLSNNSNTIIKADADASSAEEYAQLQAGHNYLRVTSSAGGSTTTQGADKLTFNGNVVYHAGRKPTVGEIGAAAASHGTHVTYATAAPLANGTAAVGTSSKVAREDHVHPAQTAVTGNAGTATKLATARTLTIGNTGKNFDGSGNVSWNLSEIGAASSGHTHSSIRGTAGGSWASATVNPIDDCVFQFAAHINKNATGIFTTSNNANAIISFNRHEGNYASQLGFNNSGDIFYRSADGSALADGTAWKQIAFTSSSISGNAASATRLQNARNIKIGNTSRSFNGTADVTWTLADIGAAASSHSHSYLPLGGGTVTGNITFSEVTSTTYPANSSKITWNGSTDGADIYYRVTASDKGQLVLNLRDDADATIGIALNGAVKATFDTNGYYSGTVNKANTLATARTLTIGNTGKTFNGGGNVSWSLSEIGAAASSHGHSNMLTFKSNHARDWTNATSMADKVYMGGWHGSITDSSKTKGYISLALNSGAALDVHLDGDYYANENNLVLNTGNYKSYVTPANIGAANASHEHNYLNVKGTNTINSTANDTTAKWGEQKNSVHWYTEDNKINGQPSQWGYLINIGQSSEVHQIWMTQAGGDLSHRGGNGNGWSGTWRTILDSSNYNTWAAAKNHTHNYAASSHTHNYAGSSSAGGNANAAVKLATARSINGTNFDGSGNITTANWGTARTITIGGTGKSVNGSENVSWSLSEIGALPTAGGTVSGNLNVTGAFSIGGKKITINSSAPSSPAVGDIWIKI